MCACPLALWPADSADVTSCMPCSQGLAAPVSSIALGRAGPQFFFMDSSSRPMNSSSSGGSSSGGGNGFASSSLVSSTGMSSNASGSGSGHQEPLLYRLSKDQPGEVSVYRILSVLLLLGSVWTLVAGGGLCCTLACCGASCVLPGTHPALPFLTSPPLPSCLQGLLFMSALAAFETRTLYANSSGDHLVGCCPVPPAG